MIEAYLLNLLDNFFKLSLKVTTIQQQKEKKKREKTKLLSFEFIPRTEVGKKETRFYRLFSEGNGEMEPPLEEQRALTDVEHAPHECRRFLSLLRPTGPGNMAIRRGGNTVVWGRPVNTTRDPVRGHGLVLHEFLTTNSDTRGSCLFLFSWTRATRGFDNTADLYSI